MESDSDDSKKYNLTPMTVEANESLFPTNGNYIPKKQYSTSCKLFYYNGKRAKIINYDLIKHVNPQGFFEVNNNCKIIKMLSQTQMKINIDGTNSPEGSKCHSAIFSLCFCFFFVANMISMILGIISGGILIIPIIMGCTIIICLFSICLSSFRNSKRKFIICYLKDEKSIKIEKNFTSDNQLNISIPLETIANVKMNYDETISTYKLYTNDGKEIELFKLYLGPGGIPFIEGEDIFNDWFEFLRKKY